MTTKQFIKRLENLTENEFVLDTHDEYELPEDHIVLSGEDADQVFILHIIKVE